MNGIVWIIDFGATDQMTSIRSLLFDIITLLIPYLVSLPNGYKVKVTNVGSLALFSDLILHNVPYIPSFKHNLIYVHKLLSYCDDVVQFTKSACTFQGPSVRKPVVLDRLDNGLYKLFQHVTSLVESVNVNSYSSIACSLHVVSNNVAIDNSSFVHIDTWGPYSTPTHSGSKYILTTIDDYTRATWTHLMGAKSNAFDLLKPFIFMVETQFQTKVQTVRSDNALELGSNSSGSLFFSEKGDHSSNFLDVTFHKHVFPFSKSFVPSSLGIPSSFVPSHFSDDSHSPLSPHVPVSSPQSSLVSTPPSPSSGSPDFIFSPFSSSSSHSDYVCPTLPPSASLLAPSSSESLSFNATTIQLHNPEPYTYSQAAAIPEWDLDEEVFMKVPPGLSIPPSCSSPFPLVCKLLKSLYDLKQASRQWGSRTSLVILPVYVDDIILIGTDLSEISFVKVVCLLALNEKLKVSVGEPLPKPEEYRCLVGKLKLLTHTRPDISFVVQHLNQFLQTPCVPHIYAALHLLSYLKDIFDFGLFFSNSPDLSLMVYFDSDWASCADSKRSVTGFCVFLGDCLVSWKSKKQSMVSLSSVEAEYRSMSKAAAEVTWLSMLLSDFGLPSSSPIPLYCDNQAALHIARNLVFHEQSNHIGWTFISSEKKLVMS
ncbi:uncharacterized protein LOC142165415 [Nicotiana tabacum]|uniref:Uncharacterized protein LOC142165415 n=1 Tax=Nicotiana tabacum TaxID=4097 RepID=A0AC58S517_TOBAC